MADVQDEKGPLAYVQSRVPGFAVPEHSDLLTALCDRLDPGPTLTRLEAHAGAGNEAELRWALGEWIDEFRSPRAPEPHPDWCYGCGRKLPSIPPEVTPREPGYDWERIHGADVDEEER